jgi:predicted membrane protein
LFVGISTDLLSVALTAGMFHYGYCIASALMGLFAGLICSLRNSSKTNKLYFHMSAILLLALTFAIQFIFFNVLLNFNDPKITDTPGALSINILGISVQFKL